MPPTAMPDPGRSELLRAASDALVRLAPALPPAAAVLLFRLHEALPTAELAAETPDRIAAAAAGLWDLAARRHPGEVRLRVTPPGPGTAGQAVAEIVTDDMPFLVDSALAALGLEGRTVRQLLHPVLAARRDAEGRLQAFGATLPPAGPGETVGRESMMRIAFGAAPRGTGAGNDWQAIEAALRGAMADVRAADTDQAAMLAFVHGAEMEIAASPGGGTGPARAFLRWLAEDNFVLLGHRRVAVGPDGALGIVTADNLGLLRDPGRIVFDTLHDLRAIPPGVRAAILAPTPLSVAKANARSTVHRAQHADVVVTRVFGAEGEVTGARVFFGLFAATAYTRNPRSIPLLAEKVTAILARSGVDPDSHDGRALRETLDTWPRDELFQAPEGEILAGARRALDLRSRPRTALVVRLDPFERFVSAIVWLPRDRFDTPLRERVGAMLARAYAGRLSAFHIAMGDQPLARIHYIVGTTPGAVPAVDTDVLEVAVAQAARDFRDRLGEALGALRGEQEAANLLARWGDAFPAAYRDATVAPQAVADLLLVERAAGTGHTATGLDRAPGMPPDMLTLRLAQPGGPLPLADALPLLDSLGLRAVEEVPHYVAPVGGPLVVLHVFTVHAGAEADSAAFPALLDTLDALLDGRVEADGFNRLVLRAGLDWRACWLLRAMYRWLKQVGFAFSQASVEATLAAHPAAARLLIALFHARFQPDAARDAGREEAMLRDWAALLDGVANPDEDRVLTRLMLVLQAMQRTTFFQDRSYLAFKLASADAGEMPLPRPWREIFVHSPRMEGCHLRAGPVARGGIRWSDRREDFRTEILGLMKAQRLKNVVIVPTGAKGGFVLKQAPSASDRDAFMAEGIACYRVLIGAMLDLADNLEDGRVVTPDAVVRRDGDDPYMVAAADKGTASFSDIANAMAVERGFWLGDAFASGGSQGYDHKAMGITARGAWVMIARHFAELGLDIQADPFTCAGVGDMSGDVFGNGLLVSRQTRLVAAFDHRHIFLDPAPDPDGSYNERARLFALPRSSWADYDRGRISAGGGVYSRSEKRIPLSPQAQALLDIAESSAEPAAVMRAILRAPVDLLYFGGIGTYAKAAGETQMAVGDRANDAVRVQGGEIRARVLGEGANLAITQAGRIEYARDGANGTGGRINTDALDNAAGVSTSDHEVNIKILTAEAERDGALTRRQRDSLLAAMTDEVAALVLRDNHAQSLAVSLEAQDGVADLPGQAALMARLEREEVLDRALAGLPDGAALAARIAQGDALLRPEVAALLPVAKLWLTEALDGSGLVDEPVFASLLLDYFPTPLREGHAGLVSRHRLRRELIGTAIANTVANRLGPAALGRLSGEPDPVRLARATWLAGALLEIEPMADAVDQAPAPAATRLQALRVLRRLHEVTTRALLGSAELDLPLAEAIAALRPGIAALETDAAAAVAGNAATLALVEAGLPAPLAARVAAAPALEAALAIVRLAASAGVQPAAAGAAWQRIGQALGFDALRSAATGLALPGAFGGRAKAALLDDLAASQLRLAAQDMTGVDLLSSPEAIRAAKLAQEAALAPDLAGIGLAARMLAGIPPVTG